MKKKCRKCGKDETETKFHKNKKSRVCAKCMNDREIARWNEKKVMGQDWIKMFIG